MFIYKRLGECLMYTKSVYMIVPGSEEGARELRIQKTHILSSH